MITRIESEPVTDIGAELGEGPLWDASGQRVVWVDIQGRRIHHTDPNDGTTVSQETPEAVGAVAPGVEGWVAALPSGLFRVAEWTAIAAFPGASPAIRSNDGKVDPSGNMVQGTMDWDAAPGAGQLLRIDPTGDVEILADSLTISNGLDWSDDGSILYHIDTPTGLVMRYRYSSDGPLTDPAVALDLNDLPGDPDGMCIDTDGAIWVALWGGHRVCRFTPKGTLDREVQVPTANVSSCAFGGAELNLMFITTASGESEPTDPMAGRLFVASPGAQGRPGSIFGAHR